MKSRLLPLRLLVWICLIVGLVGLGVMVWISGWPRDGAGADAAFVTPHLPGYRFRPEILPRLGEIGGGALGLGLALLVVERILARREARFAANPPAASISVRSPLRTGLVAIAAIVAGLAATLGWRWHSYVTNTVDPYDEVGVSLNAAAPGPINAWGCERLKATFAGRAIPPHGCSGPDGGWR